MPMKRVLDVDPSTSISDLVEAIKAVGAPRFTAKSTLQRMGPWSCMLACISNGADFDRCLACACMRVQCRQAGHQLQWT